MSEFTGHNGDVPSSIAGIADTGSMVADSDNVPQGKGQKGTKPASKTGQGNQFKITAKRQSMINGQSHKDIEAYRFLNLVQEMGRDKLEKPFLKVQLDDLRHDDKPDGHYSRSLVLAVIAGAKTLPYATDAAMDLLAANSDADFEPVAPRIDDKVA